MVVENGTGREKRPGELLYENACTDGDESVRMTGYLAEWIEIFCVTTWRKTGGRVSLACLHLLDTERVARLG